MNKYRVFAVSNCKRNKDFSRSAIVYIVTGWLWWKKRWATPCRCEINTWEPNRKHSSFTNIVKSNSKKIDKMYDKIDKMYDKWLLG